jgi:anti-sigma B factor antagonist
MAPIESLSVTVSRRDLPGVPAPKAGSVVVRLRGEHDLSTVPELSAALTQAITLDDVDVVVDLTEVAFMGVATLRVILRARELLRAQSRCLVLRSPPSCVRRVLELCGDAALLAPAESTPVTAAAGALGTWVPVPATDRADQPLSTSPRLRSIAPDPVAAGWLPALVSSASADQPSPAVAGPGAP